MILHKITWNFLFLIGMLIIIGISYGMTVMIDDKKTNENEIPRISFNKAYMFSTLCLSTNVSQFICTQARSIRSKYHGGWEFMFENNTTNAHYIHIDENGKLLVNNIVYSPSKYDANPLPTLSIHTAIESAIRFRQGTLLRAIWAGGKGVWHIYVMNDKREKIILTVDADKNVKPLNLKDTKWPPSSDLQVEVDGL